MSALQPQHMIGNNITGMSEDVSDEIAALEMHRLKELSRGMVQQVYNDSTYRLPIWNQLGRVIRHIVRTKVSKASWHEFGDMLSWQYAENTVRIIRYGRGGRHYSGKIIVNLTTEEITYEPR